MDELSAAEKCRPQSGHLLVRPDPPPPNIGLIHLPEQNQLRPESGVVVVPHAELMTDYPPGAHVIYAKNAGMGVKIDGEPLLILFQDEIQCVIPEDTMPEVL